MLHVQRELAKKFQKVSIVIAPFAVLRTWRPDPVVVKLWVSSGI